MSVSKKKRKWGRKAYMIEEMTEKKIVTNRIMYSKVMSIIINTVLFAIFLYGIRLLRCNEYKVNFGHLKIDFNTRAGMTYNVMQLQAARNILEPIWNEMIMVLCNFVLYLIYNIPRFLCVKRKQLTYSWKWYIVTLIVPVFLVYIGISGIYLCYYLFVY